MTNTFDNPHAANLVGLWDFLAGGESDDTGLDDGFAQNGAFVGGATASGGQLQLNGDPDRFDVGGNDDPFDLAEGTLITEFTQEDNSRGIFQAVVNRGEFFDSASEGFFEIQVGQDGAVQVMHVSNGVTIVESTGAGFAPVGDTIRATYEWSESEGGRFLVENLTASTSFEVDTPAGVNFDIGDNDGTSFIFGVRENVDEIQEFNVIKHFDGSIDYVAVYDGKIGVPPTTSDGVITNDDDGDLIDTSYTGDPDGDVVDGGDSIFPPVGSDDDIIDANGGDDTIEAGEGSDSVDGGAGDDLINTDGAGTPALPDDGIPPFNGQPGVAADPDPSDDLDTVNGGAGDDTISTGDDNDVVQGGQGDDVIDGGLDDDELRGGADDDDLTGGQGDDTLVGGSGDDTIDGGDGSDSVFGGEGDDLIETGGGTLNGLPDLGFPSYNGLPEVPADSIPDNDLDTVFGGAGDDTISTGDDADLISGDEGNDVIDGGLDADTIDGGVGDDNIIGGEGSDSILGGDGADTIYGGLGPSFPDATNIPDDLPGALADPRPDNGQDVIDGGAGDDLIFGEDDDDTIEGGAGNDTIDGGIDEDDMSGGDDRDTFVNINGGDRVDGGEGFTAAPEDDFDTLDLRGSVDNTVPGGRLQVTLDGGNPENGVVTYFDADDNVTDTVEFFNIERVIPCFTPGTMIATPRGERAVETLEVGDRIITRDNGIQEIRWLGTRNLDRHEMMKATHMQPVLIREGALGKGLPERDMMVSPNHRVLVANDKTSLYFDESEVLVAAKHLTGLDGVDFVEVSSVTYIHFMFDQHEVVLSDGTWTESFQPGDQTLAGIGNAQRQEIFELFPELNTPEGVEAYQAARRSLKKHEAFLVVN